MQKKIEEIVNLFESYISHTEFIKNIEESDKIDEEKKAMKFLDEAIKKGTQLCKSPIYSATEKLLVFKALLKYDKLEGAGNFCSDILSVWRDTIVYQKNAGKLDEILLLLKEVVKCSDVPSHERIYTAVHLYNSGQLHICYICLADLAIDVTLNIEYRLESLKFLFASGEDEERIIVQKIMLQIIGDHSLMDEVRYKAIASYIPKTGIKVAMNFNKLMVPYEEGFVCTLQTAFFNDSLNNIRYRILSAQNLLQMSDNPQGVSSDDKRKIITQLFEISKTGETENIRADAADVILRLGNSDDKIEARNIILNIGFLADGSKRKGDIQTIYDNSQNIHNENIDKCIQEYLENLLSIDCAVKLRDFQDVEIEINECLRRVLPISIELIENDKEKVNLINNKRSAVHRSLLRVSIDTATFTSKNLTSAEILVLVWSRIHSGEFDTASSKAHSKGDMVDFLERRLIDELADMDDTCSSGSGRFVSIFTDAVKISWEDQLKANVKGRLEAILRNCADESIQKIIAYGSMGDESYKLEYLNYIKQNLRIVEEDLYIEFVGGDFISREDFERFMINIKNEWLK